MEVKQQKVERVCGRIFLLLFLLILPVVWLRLFYKGAKKDPFENESRYADNIPVLNADSLLSGKYQEQLENSLADQMPASETIRDRAWSLNNSVYKKLSWISTEKGSDYRLIGNNLYAYGSYDYLLNPRLDDDTLYFSNSNSKASKRIRDTLNKSFKYYNNLPIKNKYLYLVTKEGILDFDNPNDDYYEQIKSYYPGFKSDKLDIPDIETYAKYYLKNDHHWNYEGAYQGYQDIVHLILGNKEKVLKPKETVHFNYDSQGSKSKSSHFFEYKEYFTAYRFDFPNFEISINDASVKEYGNQNFYLNTEKGRNGSGPLTYGKFYGQDFGVVHYKNKAAHSRRKLIMIGFSDTNAINSLVASHFSEMWVIDPRFCPRKSFEKIIRENKVDNLLLVPNTSNQVNALVESPKGYE